MASTQAPAPSESTPAPGAGQQREWRGTDFIVMSVALAALFVVIFWAALGQPPLAGTTVVGALGLIAALLANICVGALASGSYVEIRHPDWTRLHGIDHVFLYGSLVLMAVVDGFVGWWLFSSDSGTGRWLFLAVALAGLAAGAWWAWPAVTVRGLCRGIAGHPRWSLWPHHPGQQYHMWRCFTPLAGLVGAALGVVIAVGYLGISAWYENTAGATAHSLPVAITDIHGGYVALGDSYSAGEGLPPFADNTALTSCDRSVSDAYPVLLDRLLRASNPRASFSFTACSGALISNVLHRTQRAEVVPPQVSGAVERSVGLVTLTIGGDNAIFSKVVTACVTSGDCLDETFPPAGVAEATARPVPPGPMMTQWAPATIEEIGQEDAGLFATLRRDFPNARIVVVGYPYLFPKTPSPGFPFYPPMCASILNRLSTTERVGIRSLQDSFNNRIYEEAVAAHIEFVSPVAIWDGHEPCGASGQYTNAIKPYLNFPNPINGGSFHPNQAGQQTLAALLACYLDSHHQPPDPYAAGAPHHLTIPPDKLADPSQLGLVQPPGLTSVPGAGVVRGC
jgi:GDSL-like Lipase/Acylhydrolase family